MHLNPVSLSRSRVIAGKIALSVAILATITLIALSIISKFDHRQTLLIAAASVDGAALILAIILFWPKIKSILARLFCCCPVQPTISHQQMRASRLLHLHRIQPRPSAQPRHPAPSLQQPIQPIALLPGTLTQREQMCYDEIQHIKPQIVMHQEYVIQLHQNIQAVKSLSDLDKALEFHQQIKTMREKIIEAWTQLQSDRVLDMRYAVSTKRFNQIAGVALLKDIENLKNFEIVHVFQDKLGELTKRTQQ